MFHIKICGARRVQDVHAVADSGADSIGFNYFPGSVRYVDPDSTLAIELSRAASERELQRVGVFVNASVDEILHVANRIKIDLIQLHGNEPVSLAEALRTAGSVNLIRAIKLPTGPLEPSEIEGKARPWIEVGCHPLFDADAGAAHGGSGKALDWNSIRRWSESQVQSDYTLAGGLNPQNVVEAIVRTGAKSVDTASGVERPRGQKQTDLINAFVQACRAARL
jgi:phosphoribosylanthranilate isomerase